MRTQKQNLLLTALNATGPINRLRLVKLLFLFYNENEVGGLLPQYSFIPYKYGPFSYELYHDIGILEREGIVEQKGDVIKLGKMYKKPQQGFWYDSLRKHIESFNSITDHALLNRIYSTHPFYTIFSRIEKREKYSRNQKGIVTIGYQEKTVDQFLYVIIKNQIDILIDIRAVPYSRKYPFIGKHLERILAEFDIQYISIPELGVPSEIRHKKNKIPNTPAILKWYSAYMKGHPELVDRVVQLAGKKKIALMCYEKDPEECHRYVLSTMIRGRGLHVEDL